MAFTQGVPLLSFSRDGSLLLSCGLDRLHSIAVHRLWYESTAAESAFTPSGSGGRKCKPRQIEQRPNRAHLETKLDQSGEEQEHTFIRPMHPRDGRVDGDPGMTGPGTLPPAHPHSSNPASSIDYLGTEWSASECEVQLLFSAPTSETPVTDILVLRNNDLITKGGPRHCSFWVADDGAGSSVAQGQPRQQFPRGTPLPRAGAHWHHTH